jgi:two-component system CheB/CheR fusion protein
MNEQRLRILLVDDYPDALDTWSTFLEMQGYDVTTAADGKEAVDRAVSEHPDLIIMDLSLPVITGFEAARRLRALPETAAIPLIAATGYSAPAQIDDAKRAGFEVVLIKPCNPDELLEEVTRLLDRARAGNGQPRSDVG